MEVAALIVLVFVVLMMVGWFTGPSRPPRDDQESSNSLYIRDRRDGPRP